MGEEKRLRALDAFRGLAVAAMILVNSPGSDEVYGPLRHAEWHGFTPADLVFPAFLVIMGAASALAHSARRGRGESPAALLKHAAWRASGLAALGLLTNAIVFQGGAAMRLPGVLQRIALCYLGVHLLLILESGRAAAAAAAALLAGYWLLLTRVAVPQIGAGVLTPEGNLAYWLDRRLLGPHLLERWGDPEGLLSTLGALATALIGLVAGRTLLRRGAAAAPRLAASGLLLAAFGLAWSLSFPLNKHLWTGSYALLGSGLSLIGLAALLLLVEGRSARWARPFEAMGRHALGVYVLAGVLYDAQEFITTALPDGAPGNLKLWLNARLFGSWLAPRDASLGYAASFAAASVAAVSLVAKRLDRR